MIYTLYIASAMILVSFANTAPPCSSQRICEIASSVFIHNKGVIPDRISHGQTIRGGNPSTTGTFTKSCKIGSCRFQNRGRMRRLLSEAQKRAAKVILNGRKESDLNEAEVNLLERLRSAKFVDPADGGLCESYCASGGQAQIGLSYLGPCVCPVFEQFPDETILFTFAHEIAHLGDGCFSLKERLTEKGPIKALRFEEHPFAKSGGLNQCLADNGIPMGWYSDKTVDEQMTHYVRTQVKVTFGKTLGEILLEPIKAFADLKSSQTAKHQECLGMFGGSQMPEAQCDHVGWEVLGDFLKDHPFDPQDTFAAARAFSAFTWGCASSATGVIKESSGLFSVHPPERDRMDKIALKVPSIRQALGCKSAAKTCEIARDTSKPATSSWSSEVKPAQPNANR